MKWMEKYSTNDFRFVCRNERVTGEEVQREGWKKARAKRFLKIMTAQELKAFSFTEGRRRNRV